MHNAFGLEFEWFDVTSQFTSFWKNVLKYFSVSELLNGSRAGLGVASIAPGASGTTTQNKAEQATEKAPRATKQSPQVFN